MQYFKIVNNQNNIIGVVTSDNFIAYQPVIDSFLRSDETLGEFINYRGTLYRSTWMKPIKCQVKHYEQVQVFAIDKEEYDILFEAFKVEEEIIVEREEEEYEEEPYVNPIDTTTIEFVRSSKIKEMSHTCNKTIEAGFDITLSNQIHHFSLTIQDQLNLISLSSMAAQGMSQIPYHADGELCKYYTPEEINAIVNQATYFKTYHTTYFNGLKAYINSLETIEEINAITYGTPLPEEYQTDVWKQLNQ